MNTKAAEMVVDNQFKPLFRFKQIFLLTKNKPYNPFRTHYNKTKYNDNHINQIHSESKTAKKNLPHVQGNEYKANPESQTGSTERKSDSRKKRSENRF